MDLDNLSQDFQQKLAQNKSLFKELKDLEAELEARRLQIEELDEALNRERNRGRRLAAEKEAVEEQVRDLTNVRVKNEEKIDKLFEDNQRGLAGIPLDGFQLPGKGRVTSRSRVES